jgi:hypothetical protein
VALVVLPGAVVVVVCPGGAGTAVTVPGPVPVNDDPVELAVAA